MHLYKLRSNFIDFEAKSSFFTLKCTYQELLTFRQKRISEVVKIPSNCHHSLFALEKQAGADHEYHNLNLSRFKQVIFLNFVINYSYVQKFYCFIYWTHLPQSYFVLTFGLKLERLLDLILHLILKIVQTTFYK